MYQSPNAERRENKSLEKGDRRKGFILANHKKKCLFFLLIDSSFISGFIKFFYLIFFRLIKGYFKVEKEATMVSNIFFMLLQDEI